VLEKAGLITRMEQRVGYGGRPVFRLNLTPSVGPGEADETDTNSGTASEDATDTNSGTAFPPSTDSETSTSFPANQYQISLKPVPVLGPQEGEKKEKKKEKKKEIESALKKKCGRKRSEELTYKEFNERWKASKAEGEKFLPDGDPLFSWGKEIGISYEFLSIAFNWFRDYHLEEAPEKKQKDWRATFRRYVRQDWCKLWFRKDGAWHLNVKGKLCAVKYGYDENLTSSSDANDWTSTAT
jgi:hypothetical protein